MAAIRLFQPGALIALEQFDHACDLRALAGRRRCWCGRCAPGRRHICCGLRFRRIIVRIRRNGRAGSIASRARGDAAPEAEEVAFGHALIREAAYPIAAPRHEAGVAPTGGGMVRGTRHAPARRAPEGGGGAGGGDCISAGGRGPARAIPRLGGSRSRANRDFGPSPAGADRAELALLKARICLELGRARKSAATFEDLLTLGLSPRSECSTRIGFASALRILDDIPGALDHLEKAQELATRNDWPALLSQCHNIRGNLLFPTGRGTRATPSIVLRSKRLSARAISKRQRERWAAWATRITSAAACSPRGTIFGAAWTPAFGRGLGRVEAANRPMAVLATWFELRLADALQEARLAVERARLMTQPRAELVSRHIYAIALAELGRDAEALEVLEEGRRITRELEAWRFDAENLANIAEIRLRAGQVGEARSTIETALDIFRRAGMAYYGPIALATLARTEPDPQSRRKIIDEIEELLSTVALSHNHWLGRRQLIEWVGSSAIPTRSTFTPRLWRSYNQREPSPLQDAIIRRGRALARALRGDRSPDLVDEITHLKNIAENSGSVLLKIGLEECQTAISG